MQRGNQQICTAGEQWEALYKNVTAQNIRIARWKLHIIAYEYNSTFLRYIESNKCSQHLT